MLSLVITGGKAEVFSERKGRVRTICQEKTSELRSDRQVSRCTGAGAGEHSRRRGRP